MNINNNAKAFFDACETGKGWEHCIQYCAPDASFSCQSCALAEIHTLEEYVEWAKGLLIPVPDAHYEMKGFAVDDERGVAIGFATFHGTQTGEGGPVPATNATVASDYVYAMEFAGGKITHMTKIWNDGDALAQLGWS